LRCGGIFSRPGLQPTAEVIEVTDRMPCEDFCPQDRRRIARPKLGPGLLRFEL